MAFTLTSVTPATVGAEGGYFLEIIGDFSAHLGQAFRVHIGTAGDATDPECQSGRIGQATNVYPLSATSLRAYTPVLTAGETCDVFVRLADNSASQTLAAAITVHTRDYLTTTHAMRRVIRADWEVGPKHIAQDTAAPDGQDGQLKSIFEAISESDGERGGLRQTRLTAPVQDKTPLAAPFVWNGTATVTTPNTSGLSVGDFISLGEDGRAFEITAITPNTSVTVDDSEETPPTGPVATAIAATLTWNGTTTVTTTDTSEVGVGTWIRLDSDGQWFEVESLVTNTSITILNPHSLTIPTGATPSSRAANPVTSLVTTEIAVETTLNWPDSGRIAIDGVPYLYAAKTLSPPAFTGLTHTVNGVIVIGLRQTHNDASVVTDISRARSAIELARRAMLVDYAEGEDLNALGRNYGVDRFPFLASDDVFREIVKALAYNPKGTMFGLELALDALVGPGNYEIYEDLINFPCTVFITLLGGPFTSDRSEGKAYLAGGEFQRPTSDTQVSIEESVAARGTIHSVTWKDDDHTSDFRSAYPTVETLVEYEGDLGTKLWYYRGTNQAADVTVLADSQGIEITHPGGQSPSYRHPLRVQPDSIVKVNTITYLDSAGTISAVATATQQWCCVIFDGAQRYGWGIVNNGANVDIGLMSGSGAFVDGVAATLAKDTYYAIELRKFGQDVVELWIDGKFKKRVAVADFPANPTALTCVDIGALLTTATGLIGRFKQCGFYCHTATDYWGARGEAGDVDVANPTRLDVNIASFFSSPGDVGKRIQIRNSSVSNAQGGNANGIYEIESVISDEIVSLVGETFTSAATVNADGNVKRIRVQGRQFRFPDDLGKEIVISGSDQGNDGTYVIDTLLDADTLVDLGTFATPIEQDTDTCEVVAATFVTETGLSYRVDPVFETEANVNWEMSDAGSVSGTTLTLRQALPIAAWGGASGTNRVLSVVYSQVLSAQVLLDTSIINELTQLLPTVEFSYYPFYLSDPLAFIRAYLDDVTAAGVIPEFLEP